MTKTIALQLLACKSAVHCRTCREDSADARAWRESVAGEAEFDCPFGVTLDKLPSRGFGDTIEKMVGKVATGIGDRYKAALKNRLGGIPCGACEAERKRLNTMTADHVRAEREQIIEATVTRAKNLPRWRDRIRAKLGDAIAPETMRRIVGECLDEAADASGGGTS